MAHLIRASRLALQLSRRTLFTSTASRLSAVEISEEGKMEHYPKIGKRDIVGFGRNGEPIYMDMEELPCPAVRFKADTPDLAALKQKELGDWKQLSMEEKKTLYRASFCQTFAEMQAPSGDWKNVLSIILLAVSVSGWFLLYINKFVYPAKPSTYTAEWQEKQIEQMVRQGQGPIAGVSSKWDYENNKWK